MTMTLQRILMHLALLTVVTAGFVGCVGARRTHPAAITPTCPPSTIASRDGAVRIVSVLDGQVLGEEVKRAPRTPAQARIAALPPDSVFTLRFVRDSAGLATYGLCPGATAFVVVTVAEAQRRGLRPSPPQLCLRTTAGRALPRMAFPMGSEFRFKAGQLEMLAECDRAAPPGVTWSSSAPGVATVDSSGVLRAPEDR